MTTCRQFHSSHHCVEHILSDDIAIQVKEGDNLIFDVASSTVTDFKRQDNDCVISFSDNQTLTAKDFFLVSNQNRKSILTFEDELITQDELSVALAESNNITVSQLAASNTALTNNTILSSGEIQGEGDIHIDEDAQFNYEFTLDKDIPEASTVKVLLNGETMPAWMTLNKIGERHYVLSGSPSHKNVGDYDIDIVVET